VATNSNYTVVGGINDAGTVFLKLRAREVNQEDPSEVRESPWIQWIRIDGRDDSFVNTPVITSRERTEHSGNPNVFDVWVFNTQLRLIHIPLDIEQLLRDGQPPQDQRDLGGRFFEAPKAAYHSQDVYFLLECVSTAKSPTNTSSRVTTPKRRPMTRVTGGNWVARSQLCRAS
jgi:hypothetical protein